MLTKTANKMMRQLQYTPSGSDLDVYTFAVRAGYLPSAEVGSNTPLNDNRFSLPEESSFLDKVKKVKKKLYELNNPFEYKIYEEQ